MVNKLKVQTKLLLPLSMLILIVLMLSTSFISHQYTKSRLLIKLENGINLSTSISKLVHSLQKERGMTSGFLASNGVKFKNELVKQRKITDERAKKLDKYLLSTTDIYVHKALRNALLNINKLVAFRENVDKLLLNAKNSIEFYSKINDELLNVIVEVSKISKLPIITQNIIAYSSFLYAKENAGIERAVGTAILAEDKYMQSLQISFINLIAIEKLYTKTFLKYASDEARNFYELKYRGKSISEVQRIRRVILYTDFDKGYGVKPEYWFENITKKINKLMLVDDFLEKEILKNINNELSKTYQLFGAFAFLNFISIVLFLSMIVMIIKLIKSEKRLKSIIDKYIISSTTDLKGNILEVSDAFCDISGFNRKELIGKSHNVIRHPDMPRSAFREMWSTIKQGKQWSGKVKNITKDGGYYWVYAHIEPLFNRKNKIEGYAAIRLDITDSINLEKELIVSKDKDKAMLQQSKLAQMGEMISMIAHQWRQPLTAISSTSSDMLMKIMLDKYDKEYFSEKLKKIDNLSQYLSQTIDDFRNFYKDDKQKEKVLYSSIAKKAMEIVSSSLESKNIALKSDFSCQRKIDVLVNELRQVILNLIKNAEDILIENGINEPYISLRTYDDDLYSYLEVIDNGGGIADDIIDKIFDPYFSTKVKKDGTGLGLYMSKMIVEEHCGGSLSVSNIENGAVFIIKIPIADEF